MYYFVVRQQLKKAFRQINAGEYGSILKQFAPQFEHVLGGDHALSGRRHTHEANRRWYERLAVMFPDLRFEVKNVMVSGWPWATVASVEWRDHFTTPAGERLSNEGVHVFQLRWGRVTSLHIYCDTQKLTAVCQHLAQQGIAEAGAGPITG